MIFLNFLLCSSSSIKIKEMLTMTPLCEFHEDLLGTIAQYQQEDLEQDVK